MSKLRKFISEKGLEYNKKSPKTLLNQGFPKLNITKIKTDKPKPGKPKAYYAKI